MTLPFSNTTPASSSPPDDVTLNIYDQDAPTGNNAAKSNIADTRIWNDSNYNFSNDVVMMPVDAANSNDLDFVSESSPPRKPERASDSNNNYAQSTEREVRFSYPDSTDDQPRCNGEVDEVLVCGSNDVFRRKSSLMRSKTKSRLVDPPEDVNVIPPVRRGRSQVLGKRGSESDDNDSFSEEDLPEDYKKVNFSVFLILQLVSFVLIVGALVCSLTLGFLKKRTIFELELWKWELMVLVLISGRLVSGWGIRIVVFLIERNFLLRKRVLYFVYGLRNAVQNCIWLALLLIAWQCIFDKKVARVTRILPYVTKIWVCLLVGTLIWLLKTLLVKVLASSFHVSTFFDRIQESLFNQYVIETLSGPPLVEMQQDFDEVESIIIEVQKVQNVGTNAPADRKGHMFWKSGRVFGATPRECAASAGAGSPLIFSDAMKKDKQNGIKLDHLYRLSQKNISAWNMKRLMNIVRKGVLLTLDEKTQGSADKPEAKVQITSNQQASHAAKKIFVNVAKPGSKYIYQEDLMRFMREDEVAKTMHLFECGITKRALKNWVVNAFIERRALALSLNDTKTAVNKLHLMLNVLMGLIIFIIWLLILRVASMHFFIFLSSQLLLVVFMFGNTCKTTFEAIIFLFVMHPFDVADRVEVDGVQMVVEEMNILTTVFLKYDNHKIYYPNSVLATKPINNYYRSPDMEDAIDFSIHVSTPAEKIAIMKERIMSYINNKSDHWYPAPLLVMRDVEDTNRVKWSMWPTHKMNFQDMGERFVRRSLLVQEMVKIFRELDIEHRMVPLEVNVRNLPMISSNRVPSNWSVCAD